MDNDDKMIGRLVSRRRALALIGTVGSAAVVGGLVACNQGAIAAGTSGTSTGGTSSGGTSTGSTSTGSSLPGCVVRPAATEGPYWVDEQLERSDIRSDPGTGAVKTGVPLTLGFVVSKVATGGCTALSGVMVDIWHCDATGKYSDETSEGTSGQKFLRGSQLTDASGKVSFTTIWPGWYSGRAVHIHFRLRVLSGGSVTSQFVSQIFFDDGVTDAVLATSAYSGRGTRDTRNTNDNIYQNAGGNQLLLTTAGSVTQGFTGTFEVGMNLS